MSKKRVNPGDIIAVDLGDKMVAAGIVIFLSKWLHNGMLVGFYDQLFKTIDEVDIAQLGGPFIRTPNYTGKQLISTGQWHVIGNSPELLSVAEVPELRVAYDLMFKDDFVRKLAPEELQNYVGLSGQGGGYVENWLRKHFNSRVLTTTSVTTSIPPLER
jgi:hypothetical protein